MTRRPAYSLLELLAVIAIIGMMASLTVRLLPESLGNLASRVEARRLVRDLNQTRSRAIATGSRHRLVFAETSGAYESYTIVRVNADGSTTAVDLIHEFPDKLTVTGNGGYIEFDFDGATNGANLIVLAGAQRSVQVSLATLTGACTVSEL